MMTGNLLILPRRTDAKTLFEEVHRLSYGNEKVPRELSIDFSRLHFITPAGVTYLGNLTQWLEVRGRHVRLINHDDRTKQAIQYLDDCGFFLSVEGLPIRAAAKLRPTTLPLERIKPENSHHWLQSRLMPWLTPTLGIGRASLYPLEMCIQELIQNIREHSGRDAGSIFVQHFPARREVVVSIADFGRGIPETVRFVEPGLNDAQTIVRALQHGFSSKSKPARRGAGLDLLIETVVRTNRGKVDIFSGGGHVAAFRDGDTVRLSAVPGAGFCPGVTFDISLRTDTIEIIDDQPEALEW
jgi:anti-anti-sigma regulatory factor